jgi:hypothetical protein
LFHFYFFDWVLLLWLEISLVCNWPHDAAFLEWCGDRIGGMNKKVLEGGIGVFKARVGKWWVVIGIPSY